MLVQKPSLVQSLSQKQVLSPVMKQTIKLLALPTQELTEVINEELEKNPFLEKSVEQTAPVVETVPVEASLQQETDKRSDTDEAALSSSTTETGLDTALLDEASFDYKRSESDKFNEFLENTPEKRSKTLEQFLLEQLSLSKVPAGVAEVAEVIISALEPGGFLPKMSDALPISNPNFEEALSLVQGFDPEGVAQWTPKDALLFQARKKDKIPPHAIEILEKHLDLVKSTNVGNFQRTMKKVGLSLSEKEVQAILDFFSTLNPIPGNGFGSEAAFVIPDVVIHHSAGEISSTWNGASLPSLSFDPDAEKIAENDSKVASFVKEYKKSGQLFITALKNRNESFKRTVAALLVYQKDFFLLGPGYLKPLTMKTVSEEIGFSESTVSRIVDSKYIGTDWGVFPLRKFFSCAAVGGVSGKDTHSREAVKVLIKEIIESSNEKLSDLKISSILAERDIPISRRTVAKYRAELDIAPSFERNIDEKITE